jgi:hypothetical protein
LQLASDKRTAFLCAKNTMKIRADIRHKEKINPLFRLNTTQIPTSCVFTPSETRFPTPSHYRVPKRPSNTYQLWRLRKQRPGGTLRQ